MKKLSILSLGLMFVPSTSPLLYDEDFMNQMTKTSFLKDVWYKGKTLVKTSYHNDRRELFEKIHHTEDSIKYLVFKNSPDLFNLFNAERSILKNILENNNGRVEGIDTTTIDSFIKRNAPLMNRDVEKKIHNELEGLLNSINTFTETYDDEKNHDVESEVFSHLHLYQYIIKSLMENISHNTKIIEEKKKKRLLKKQQEAEELKKEDPDK